MRKPKDVFLVLWHDHHTDVDVTVFAKEEDALALAEQIAEEYREYYGYDPAEHEDDEPDGPVEGWLYYATLSTEGDCVYVEKKQLQDAR